MFFPGLPFSRLVASMLAALALVGLGAAAQQVEEGKQFVRLNPPQRVETGNKIEVIEFFSYGCPHCADLDQYLDSWVKTLPPDVQFRRVPVLFRESWVVLAKAYYTLEALGVEPKFTPEVFAALHKQGVNLGSEKSFFEWAASKGLDRKKVEEMYQSFAINGKLNRARATGEAYKVQVVPYLVVDGKYAAGTTVAHAALPAVLTTLVAKARAERPKP